MNYLLNLVQFFVSTLKKRDFLCSLEYEKCRFCAVYNVKSADFVQFRTIFLANIKKK